MTAHLPILLILIWLIQCQAQQDQCSQIHRPQRMDCFPEKDASEERCLQRGCCWAPKDPQQPGMPMCFFPPNYPTYVVQSMTKTNRSLVVDLNKPVIRYMANEIRQLRAEVIKETRSRLRFRLSIPSQPNRWETPIPLARADEVEPQETDYNVNLVNTPFGIRVTRANKPEQLLIDSTGLAASSLIVSNQFLQITFRLYTDHTYGPGELVTEFPHKMNKWLRVGMWAHDGQPVENGNLYGTHNFVLGQSHDGDAFGLFLLNSNAQEVAYTPMPAITYRTIGGILDFFLFTGPKPADVVAQYYDLIGHPPIPPYWSLGFHLCRYGAKSVDDVANILKRNLDAKIPIDAQWFDIDYMDAHKVWTVDKRNFGGLDEFVKNTIQKQNGMKMVIMLDPCISVKGGDTYKPYIDGMKLGIFINDSRTGTPIRGTVWPGETVFPDFSHPSTEKWWYDSAKSFHDQIPFDGLWIDMNEPASFNAGSLTGCPANNPLDNPPFVPRVLEQSLYSKTICPSALHYNSTHYDRHNLYGYDQARVTNHVMGYLFPDKRPFILSRSTFAGSGRYVYHWTGDVESTWNDMRVSVSQLINFNIFGIPMVGADICGFNRDTTEELCVRWHQLGAFYPFSRNHNSDSTRAQDPAVWSPAAIEAIRDALNLRYYLLPYLYSLFFRAHMNGSMVVRPLAFEFPDDLGTHEIQYQFMVGSCVLVTPVLDEGRTSVTGYVPAGDWINLSTGKRITSRGQTIRFIAPLHVIPILVRAGCILPLQSIAATTSVGRKSGFQLAVILSNIDDGNVETGKLTSASGELFWDDGDTSSTAYVYYEIHVEYRTLFIVPKPSGTDSFSQIDPNELKLTRLVVVGLSKRPSRVLVNHVNTYFKYDVDLQVIYVSIPNEFKLNRWMEIHWDF